jgi:hypothetical protein
VISVCDICVVIVTFCLNRDSNPVDIAECGTVACTYMEYSLNSVRESPYTSISLRNGFAPGWFGFVRVARAFL